METMDRHWREIFAPRPGAQLDEDLVSQVTTPLLSWHAENSANKSFGISIAREEAVCKTWGTPVV